MAAPVVLPSSNRAMQRLGFLKHLVSRCNAAFTSHMETIGRDLIAAASQKVQVPLSDDLSKYVHLRLQDSIYKEIKDQLAKAERQPADATATLNVEIQDLYLADARLPSHTGKLSPKDWSTYQRLAVVLGLVRKDSYSPMVRGQAMLALCSDDEAQALKSARIDANPLLLSPAQRAFFAYTLFEHDLNVVCPLLLALADRGEPFRDWEAGDLLPAIFRDIERTFRSRASSAAERTFLQSLLTYASSIEKKAGQSYAAGKGAREEHISPRLEPLVDCGVLQKPDPYFFQYEFGDAGRLFTSHLGADTDALHFLENGFFAAWGEAFHDGSKAEQDERRILRQTIAASDRLKSGLGYAPIVDSILLGAVEHLSEQGRYYEVGTTVELLRRVQKQAPSWLRFNIDRRGNLRYLKFEGPMPDGLEIAEGGAT